MSEPYKSVSIEELLAQRAWVSRIARSLARDEHAAADLEQDAWVAALRSRPRAVRGFFATVLRNLSSEGHRAGAARAGREKDSVQTGVGPPSDELAQRVELQQRLAGAVLALDTPYRRAVTLRYFEGLTPRAIARREGVPVRTVESRLRRGLERLRVRLDSETDGGRRAWLGAVALIVKLDSQLAARRVLVGVGALLAVAAVPVAAAALRPAPQPSDRDEVAAPVAPPERAPSSVELVPQEGDTTRSVSPITGPVAGADEERPAAVLRGGTVRGSVIDLEGAAIPGADLRIWRGKDPVDWGRPARLARADGLGHFVLEDLAGSRGEANTVSIIASAPGLVSIHAVTCRPNPRRDADTVIVVGPARVLEGRVVDDRGAALAGTHVRLWSRGELLRELRKSDHLPKLAKAQRIPPTVIAVTGERGGFRLPVTYETWVVQVDHPDFERWYDSVEVEQSFVEIQLRRGVTLEGRVVDLDGAPVPQVRTSLFCKDKREPVATDEDGRWAFNGLTPMEGALVGFHKAGYSLHVEVTDVHPGRPRIDTTLPPAVGIMGSVRNEDGSLPERVAIEVRGDRRFESAWYPARNDFRWEDMLAMARKVPDERGRFEFAELYEGEFSVRVWGERGARVLAFARVRAGGKPLELVVGRGLEHTATVRGRVLTSSGDPVTKFTVRLVLHDTNDRPGRTVRSMAFDDPGGRFEVVGLDPGRWSVGAIARSETETLRSASDVRTLGVGVNSVDVRVLADREHVARQR